MTRRTTYGRPAMLSNILNANPCLSTKVPQVPSLTSSILLKVQEVWRCCVSIVGVKEVVSQRCCSVAGSLTLVMQTNNQAGRAGVVAGQ